MFKKVIFSLSLFVCVLTGAYTHAEQKPLSAVSNFVISTALAQDAPAIPSPEESAAAEKEKVGEQKKDSSWWSGFPDIGDFINSALTQLINLTLTKITGFILYICGALLDYSIHFSIVAFSDLVATSESTGVYGAWKIIRNIFNIIVVFVLLKLAIQKILSGLDIALIGSFSGTQLKRVLMSLVVFTLLVNFSFFFAKVLVDVSNIFALQFYAATGATPKASVTDSFSDTGISAQVMNVLGLHRMVGLQDSSFIGGGSGGQVSCAQTNPIEKAECERQTRGDTGLATSSVSAALLANIFILITAFVFLQAAFLFAGRVVALIVLLFGSPLMFAKGVVGFLDNWSDKWWRLFWEQIFVAPLFMVMLFMTLYIGNGVNAWVRASSGGASLIGNIFSYLVLTFLMMASIKIAKNFGGTAAKKTTAWGADVFGSVVGGGAGALSRSTVGRYASHVGTTDSWLGNKLRNAATGAGAGGAFARSTLQLADYTAKQNFDVRNSAGVQGALQKFSDSKLGGTAEKRDFVTLREQEVTDQKNKIKERRESVGARWEGAKRDASTGKYQAIKFDEKTGAAVGYASGYIDDIFERKAGEIESDFRKRLSEEASASSLKLDEITKALQDSNLSQERRASLQAEKQQAMQKAAYKDFDSKKSLEDNVKSAFEAGEDTRKKAVVTNYQQNVGVGERIGAKTARIAQATKIVAAGAVNAAGATLAPERYSSTPGALMDGAINAATSRLKSGDGRVGANKRAIDGSYLQADIRNKVVSEYEKAEKKAAEAEAKKERVEAIKKKEVETFNKTYEEYAEKLGKDKKVKEKENIPEIVEAMDEEIKGLEAEVDKLKKAANTKTASSAAGLTGLDGKPLSSTKTPEEVKKANDDLAEARRVLHEKKNARSIVKEAPKTKHISENAGWTLSDDAAK
jgi:hypothetical protein